MEDILTEIEQKCMVNDCRSRAGGQRGRRPVASFPRAFRVGQSVAMDLKIRQGKKPILYMVDQFSIFTLRVVIKNKELAAILRIVYFSDKDCGKAFRQRLWESFPTSFVGTPA